MPERVGGTVRTCPRAHSDPAFHAGPLVARAPSLRHCEVGFRWLMKVRSSRAAPVLASLRGRVQVVDLPDRGTSSATSASSGSTSTVETWLDCELGVGIQNRFRRHLCHLLLARKGWFQDNRLCGQIVTLARKGWGRDAVGFWSSAPMFSPCPKGLGVTYQL